MSGKASRGDSVQSVVSGTVFPASSGRGGQGPWAVGVLEGICSRQTAHPLNSSTEDSRHGCGWGAARGLCRRGSQPVMLSGGGYFDLCGRKLCPWAVPSKAGREKPTPLFLSCLGLSRSAMIPAKLLCVSQGHADVD